MSAQIPHEPATPPNSDYLTPPFQGETLYGWCARIHQLNGNSNARRTSRHLFGDSTAGLRHDFPTRLDELSARTNNLLEPVETLIYERTVFGVFAPFLSQSSIDAVIQAMRQGPGTRIKHHLGILPSRAGPAAPLKACPTCMGHDADTYSTAWWHIEHQRPTTMVCPEHGEYLLAPGEHFHRRKMTEWFLPGEFPLADGVPLEDQARDILVRFGEWSAYLVGHAHDPFDHELLRLAYHLRAKALGFSTMDGLLQFKQIQSAFRERYSRLEHLRGLDFISETAKPHGGFLSALLREMDANRHPAKHMLLMDFLFGEPSEFHSAYEQLVTLSAQSDRGDLWSEMTHERAHLKSLVSAEGCSVSAATRKLGLPLGQAIRYLQREGIKYRQRRRVLNPGKELALQRLLRAGEERSVIASSLEIRIGFIKDYLAGHSRLRQSWQAAHYRRVRAKHHAQFLRVVKAHPEMSLKKLRAIPGNGIQWLYRHDRTWLARAMTSQSKTQC